MRGGVGKSALPPAVSFLDGGAFGFVGILDHASAVRTGKVHRHAILRPMDVILRPAEREEEMV